MTKITANHNNDRNHNSIVNDASLYDIFVLRSNFQQLLLNILPKYP